MIVNDDVDAITTVDAIVSLAGYRGTLAPENGAIAGAASEPVQSGGSGTI